MENKYPLWLFRALPSLNSLLFSGIVSNLSSCPHWNFSMKNSSMWEIKWWSRAFGNKDLLNSKLQLNNVSITSIHLVWRFVYSTRKASMMHPINTWQLSSTSMYNDVIPWNGESIRASFFCTVFYLHCFFFKLHAIPIPIHNRNSIEVCVIIVIDKTKLYLYTSRLHVRWKRKFQLETI